MGWEGGHCACAAEGGVGGGGKGGGANREGGPNAPLRREVGDRKLQAGLGYPGRLCLQNLKPYKVNNRAWRMAQQVKSPAAKTRVPSSGFPCVVAGEIRPFRLASDLHLRTHK